MKRLLALAVFWFAWVSPLLAQSSPPVGTMFTTPIAGTVTSIAKIISNVSGKAIFITNLILSPAANSVVTFNTGTGTNCATATTTPLSLTFATANPINFGDGSGIILIVPKSTDFCITVATAIAPGTIGWAQF